MRLRGSALLLPALGTMVMAAATPASGCGKTPPLAPGSSMNVTITSSGGTRRFIMFLPTSYDQSKPMPLVLNFPGHGDSNVYQQNMTDLDDPFFNPDHVVVYPQAVLGTDHKSAFSGAPYSQPDVDDLKFTDDILDNVEQSLCIDKSRIFATGKSNGGGFVNFIACHSTSARFAAFAPVAGAYYEGFGADGTACKPSRSPQPFLEIHGYNDSVIPYNGGESHGSKLPPVFAFVSAWAGRNGCAPGKIGNKSVQANGFVDAYDFGCSTQHYAVRNANHVWESTIGNADTAKFSNGPSAINASSVVMNFFRSAPSLPSS